MKDSISGVVVHIRKKSKKLVFCDIEPSESGGEKVTVVLKSWENPQNIVQAVRGDN